MGSWEVEDMSEQRGKGQSKESYFSSSFNATNLKAKYSSGWRINQLDTDMYLKGKYTFSILQAVYSGISV